MGLKPSLELGSDPNGLGPNSFNMRGMSHEHDHDDHDHSHLDPMEVRVRALQTLLTQKGYVDPATIDRIIETYETEVGPHNGAKVVARAWTEPAYADWLRRDATAAIADLDYSGQIGRAHV